MNRFTMFSIVTEYEETVFLTVEHVVSLRTVVMTAFNMERMTEIQMSTGLCYFTPLDVDGVIMTIVRARKG